LRSPFRRWPVRWRLAGVSAALTLVILVVFALVVGQLATSRIKDDFHQELLSVGSQVRTNVQLGRGPGEGITSPNFNQLALSGDAAARVVDASGQTARDTTGRLMQTPNLPDLGVPQAGITRVGNFDVYAEQLDPASLVGSSLYIQYARSRDSLDETVNRLWLFLLGGVLGGTILAALAGLAVASRAMRPIAGLTSVARKIADTRDPSLRLPMPESEDEVAELAKTLDQMLRELDAARGEREQMIQAQRDFVADASHELRTPLTSILANLELLEASFAERGADPDEEEIVAGALGSSRRMRRLVADLLLLARADAGRAGPRRLCDLGDIARTAVEEVRPTAHDHPLRLEAAAGLEVDGNPDDLHRLVLNLVENGIRHTPTGSTITVLAGRDGNEARLEVFDDGPGLPDGLGDQIFSRFVRGNGPADVSRDSGTGLGLAIVKAVAESHGGRVETRRSATGGASIVIHFPLGETASKTASKSSAIL
jgi:two-component system OmpR family sensor kinase